MDRKTKYVMKKKNDGFDILYLFIKKDDKIKLNDISNKLNIEPYQLIKESLELYNQKIIKGEIQWITKQK